MLFDMAYLPFDAAYWTSDADLPRGWPIFFIDFLIRFASTNTEINWIPTTGVTASLNRLI